MDALGGDEFLVVVTQLENALGAAHAASHLLQQLAMPYRIGDLTLRTMPSIGISLFPEHGGDIDTLVRHADSAMYIAKQGGKGCYRFFSATHCGDPALPFEHDLRSGHGWKDLQLYFQPKQLSRLPIDRVKIDRSLITTLPEDKTSIAVTEAALSFGQSLGIEMIAEGLESRQVLEFLQRRHCDRAQGYYLARPMSGAQFAEWYRHAGLH